MLSRGPRSSAGRVVEAQVDKAHRSLPHLVERVVDLLLTPDEARVGFADVGDTSFSSHVGRTTEMGGGLGVRASAPPHAGRCALCDADRMTAAVRVACVSGALCGAYAAHVSTWAERGLKSVVAAALFKSVTFTQGGCPPVQCHHGFFVATENASTRKRRTIVAQRIALATGLQASRFLDHSSSKHTNNCC